MSVASLLDTDLYKLTMQACVHKHFKDAQVEYSLVNRSKEADFSSEAVEWIKSQVLSWSELRLSPTELQYLRAELSYLPSGYFEFLESDFRLDPASEVQIQFGGGSNLSVKVKGKWHTAIWYEVPLLATISEAYFRFVDTDWDMEGQEQLAKSKAQQLYDTKCSFSEFGTRRRRSLATQELVVRSIASVAKSESDEGKPSMLAGTSNVHLARLSGLKPVGTVAHELIMGIAAYTSNYTDANLKAMKYWIDTVGHEHAGVALTDTFGTPLFLKVLVPPYSDWYAGVRQDSGDPEQFTKIISEHFRSLGVPDNTKRIVYSDSLNIEKCVELRKVALNYGLVPAFGIGTFFTNDFRVKSNRSEKSRPLNIVMKISEVNGTPAVKLSDNICKNTGDPDEVRRAKTELGYHELSESIDENKRWD